VTPNFTLKRRVFAALTKCPIWYMRTSSRFTRFS